MNYFAYFSEIEERFQRRRGSILMLSTLDWALIETWRDAGVPLQAVLRGIDAAFDKYDAKQATAKSRTRKVNGLAWCAQAVMQATEELQEAATGMAPSTPRIEQETGFEANRIASFLEQNAAAIEASISPASNPGAPSVRAFADGWAATTSDGPFIAASGDQWGTSKAHPTTTPGAPHLASEMWASTAATTAQRLRDLATNMRLTPIPLDDLDRTLTVLEEKLLAAMQTSTPEEELVQLRAQADRELAPYRSKMSAVQVRQIHQQFLHKRLLQSRNLPRLSLFYMGHEA